MKPNYNANAFLLAVPIIFATLGHQVGAESDSTPKKLSCGPGTFYSTSVISTGDCVDCPEPGQCFREATEDDRKNCDEGCGKPTPPPSVILTNVTSEATKTGTIIPSTTSSVTSSAEANNQTPSATGSSSDTERWIYIVIWVALGVMAFIACVLLFRNVSSCSGKTVLSTTPTTAPTMTGMPRATTAPTMRRMPTPATTTTLSTKESAIRTIVTGKPKSTRPKTENLQKSFSQIFSEVSSERKAAEEITSSRTKKNESSDHNIMIIGVSCTAGALFLVLLGFLIKQRKTQRNSAVNQVSLPNSSYVVVATESNSNEDIPSSQTASNVEQAEVDEENSWDLPTSLSRSALNNLAETTL